MVLKIFYLFLFCLTLTCCTNNTPNSSSENEAHQKVSAHDAVKIYETHCSMCHGLDGTLGVGNAKDLSKTTLDQMNIRKTIEFGTIGGMPRFKETFTTQEIDAVAQYVITLKRK